MRPPTLLLLPFALAALGGCVLFSVPERSSLFDPEARPEFDCSVTPSPPVKVFWTRSDDDRFRSYTVVRAMNPLELRDYLVRPAATPPPGVSVLTVISNRWVTSNTVPSVDPVYPTYFGVVYTFGTERKGSDVAVYRP